MIVKGLIDEDFVNYKKPSMVVLFPSCSFKCGQRACQNGALASIQNIEISYKDIIERYKNNDITSAVVFSGLEPFDSFTDVVSLINVFRKSKVNDDIVIYTGYTEEELSKMPMFSLLRNFSGVVLKFGRFIPNQTPHYDKTLGVNLASDNQYGKRLK